MIHAEDAIADPRRHAALGALAVIAIAFIGLAVSLSQGVGCEFDCIGAFDDPVVAAIVQGTAYSAPAPFVAVVCIAAFLATRPRRGLHLTGLGMLALLGAIQVIAIVGEPWVQRAFTSPGGMTLAAATTVGAAIAMGGLGARGLVLSARKRAT